MELEDRDEADMGVMDCEDDDLETGVRACVEEDLDEADMGVRPRV